jgi:glycine/D-amino acid oxidase-like deaminating enzyme
MVLSSTARGQHFNQEIWSQGYKETSYWLEGLSPLGKTFETPPRNVDVAIVGSGYTGLNAALQTSRGGRSTVVLEAGDPGFGCSTKNGGQVSTSIKPSLEKLSAKFGQEKGLAIRKEGENALDWIEGFVSSEKIDCSFARSGRYITQRTPRSITK